MKNKYTGHRIQKIGVIFLILLLFILAFPMVASSLGGAWTVAKSVELVTQTSRPAGLIRFSVEEVAKERGIKAPVPSLGKMQAITFGSNKTQPQTDRYHASLSASEAEAAKAYFEALPKDFHLENGDTAPFRPMLGDRVTLIEPPADFIKAHENGRYLLWEDHESYGLPVMDLIFYDNGHGPWRGLYVVRYMWH